MKVCIIDGYGLIYKSYYALVKHPLTNSKGENVSAINGFFNTLHQILRRGYDKVICAMDSKTKTFRHELSRDYKAQRQKTPPDLYDQIDTIEKILSALRLPTIRCEGFEADDVIATVAVYCAANSITLDILSQDKDLQQLVAPGITVLKVQDGEMISIDREGVISFWGVPPEGLLTFLSLTGDSADNIKGVAGVGGKTAAKLYNEWGDLDAIYANIDKISGSLKDKLTLGREDAYFSKKLVALSTSAPVGDLPSLLNDTTPLDNERAVVLLKEKELPSLAARWGKTFGVDPKVFFSSNKSPNKSYPPKAFNSPSEKDTIKKSDEDSQKTFLQHKEREKREEYEWTKKDFLRDYSSYPAVPFTPDYGKEGFALLTSLITDNKERGALIIIDDAARVFRSFLSLGFPIIDLLNNRGKIIFCDLSIAKWMISSDFNTQNTKKEKSLSVPFSPPSPGRDELLSRWDSLSRDIKDMGLFNLFFFLEMEVLIILFFMEAKGIHLDTNALKDYGVELKKRIASLESEIYKDVGHVFNIASPKQLSQVLFVERGLKPIKKIKTGYSTDSDTLERLAQNDIVANKILFHRVNSKLFSTYADALPKLCDDEGYLHPQFLQTGTATGRLSCHNPNLQNIPVRTDDGRRIRTCFTATDGKLFVSADYSQIELVVLSHLSKDAAMIDAFKSGEDIHLTTASLIFSVPKESVTPEQRRVAKTINFGVLYGMSAFRLSRELFISMAEAQSFINSYFLKYPAVEKFMAQVLDEARATGETKTLFGRVRHIANINSPNKNLRQEAERAAVNSVVQGSAADIVKLSMVRVQNALSGTGSSLLLQVHDELIAESPKDNAQVVASIMKSEMESAVSLLTPLHVSVEVGPNWGLFH